MGPMARHPDMTCFSVTDRRPVKDMTYSLKKTVCPTKSLSFGLPPLLSGFEQPLSEVELIYHEIENLFGNKF